VVSQKLTQAQIKKIQEDNFKKAMLQKLDGGSGQPPLKGKAGDADSDGEFGQAIEENINHILREQ